MTDADGGNAPGIALTDSFASDGLDLAIAATDAGIDAAIASGILDGVPIFGLLHGAYKVTKHVPALLFQRKVARMLLAAAEQTSAHDRNAFAARVASAGEAERLGEAVLLFLEKADEVEKPVLIGRIMAAHIRGTIDRTDAFRLCAMVNRAYFADISLLKKFRYGTGAPDQPIYASLAAIGLLENAGFDGGYSGANDPALSGGELFVLSRFGAALVEFGFVQKVDLLKEIAEAEADYDKAQRAAQISVKGG